MTSFALFVGRATGGVLAVLGSCAFMLGVAWCLFVTIGLIAAQFVPNESAPTESAPAAALLGLALVWFIACTPGLSVAGSGLAVGAFGSSCYLVAVIASSTLRREAQLAPRLAEPAESAELGEAVGLRKTPRQRRKRELRASLLNSCLVSSVILAIGAIVLAALGGL